MLYVLPQRRVHLISDAELRHLPLRLLSDDELRRAYERGYVEEALYEAERWRRLGCRIGDRAEDGLVREVPA